MHFDRSSEDNYEFMDRKNMLLYQENMNSLPYDNRPYDGRQYEYYPIPTFG